MLYDEQRMAQTKERLEDLRKEKKLSFEQLSKQLAERGTIISHTNLKNYEINDPMHSLYGRTRSMSIEYLVAFADFYDVSVEYLLGFSDSRKREYHDISEQLGLCDGAIDELIRCKENSGSEDAPKIYAEQDTAVLDDFLTSTEFEYAMEKIKQSLFAYYMYDLSKGSVTELSREKNAEKIEKARQTMNKYGYFPVENDVVSAVLMENAIGAISAYLRQLPKRMYEKNITRREDKK
ncbi:helix-turn-helix domain-containing protein [Zongyangia hominis]|uniref:Helix-turn-helix transcriptional regulator n=1 Tax=Zongyangia hominis TaxID=2763677 RepID=A0A926ECN7_9FIRM|nr:helix-turn-helix transcriptional regulator [Zongyangia hominis]MBC8571462.1 helix-turn-helix transcriptional regulator [Zongyangia hominis]